MPDPIPNPPEPVSERIVVYLQNLLAGITLENGYSMDAEVNRIALGGNPKGSKNAAGIITLEDEFPTEDFDNAPAGRDGFAMNVNAHCWVKSNKKVDGQEWGTVLHRMAAHVRKRVMTDFEATNLDGLCWQLTLGQLQSGLTNTAIPGLTLPINCFFWTKRNDPMVAFPKDFS